MQSIEVPEFVEALYPNMEKLVVGSPPGVPEDECGPQPSLVGRIEGGIFDGGPVFRTFWKLSEQDLLDLFNGGVVQLYFYANAMPPHGMMVMKEEE